MCVTRVVKCGVHVSVLGAESGRSRVYLRVVWRLCQPVDKSVWCVALSARWAMLMQCSHAPNAGARRDCDRLRRM